VRSSSQRWVADEVITGASRRRKRASPQHWRLAGSRLAGPHPKRGLTCRISMREKRQHFRLALHIRARAVG